jgi:hypothetical protein
LTDDGRGTRRGVERRARNESIFREANEQIQSKARAYGLQDQPIPFLCECDAEQCTTIVRLTLSEYDRVRAKPVRFLLAHGHDAPPDHVVEEHDEFIVVDKQGEEARLVAERDPRPS